MSVFYVSFARLSRMNSGRATSGRINVLQINVLIGFGTGHLSRHQIRRNLENDHD